MRSSSFALRGAVGKSPVLLRPHPPTLLDGANHLSTGLQKTGVTRLGGKGDQTSGEASVTHK